MPGTSTPLMPVAQPEKRREEARRDFAAISQSFLEGAEALRDLQDTLTLEQRRQILSELKILSLGLTAALNKEQAALIEIRQLQQQQERWGWLQ